MVPISHTRVQGGVRFPTSLRDRYPSDIRRSSGRTSRTPGPKTFQQLLHRNFSFVGAQTLVKTMSSLQKSECCSAASAAQLSENCSATSVFCLWHVAGVGFRGVGFRTCRTLEKQEFGGGISDPKAQTSTSQRSGKKKEPKPQLLGLDIFGWGGGLPREGVGPTSSVCPLKPRKSHFLAGSPGILPGYPGGARKA